MPRLLALLLIILSLWTASCSDINIHSTRPTVIENITEEVAGQLASDLFLVPERRLDILFVIDYSGSMDEEHVLLSEYAFTLYQDLTGPLYQDVAWQVGLISMDPEERMLGMITSESPDPEFELPLLFAATQGSSNAHEVGRDSVIASLAFDTEFHRHDAALFIVFISDEPDSSAIGTSIYEQLLTLSRDEPYTATEAALVYLSEADAQSCGGYFDEAGTGYLAIAEIVRSLCEPETWVDILPAAYAGIALDPIWPLTHKVLDTSSILVYLDGNLYVDWTFDMATNTVFATTDITPGTDVLIVYQTLDAV
jgi:hypothetical protein